ncbi:MAG: cortex hydrolysis/stage sporulation protein [Bacilli bacterium]|nr:cortex hydrolysis/stage sporulation protein [Bacilli bacterium]
MIEYKYLRPVARFALIGLVVVLASGCSLLKSTDKGKSIDPPPIGANEVQDGSKATLSTAATDTNGKQAANETKGMTQVTLYFKDENGFVAPISMNIPSTEQIAQESLQYMVEDGPVQSLLPQGFSALLPKGTQIKSMNIIKDQKLATVDFNNAFSSYNPQDERKIMEAVVWTLTGFPAVEKVQFQLEGKAMTEMPVFNTPLDEPLSRAMGINIELSPGINPGQSTPVTLYFSSETATQFMYFVPVTRMVKRTDQSTAAVLEQLIQGPAENDGLSAVIAADAKVLNVKQSDDKSLITVDFDSKIANNDKKIAADTMQSIILSLTESTGASQVQITVNGEKKAIATDNQNYSTPISRPAHVNQLKL